MEKLLPYQRGEALAYARRWAFGRNPAYLALDGMGGDCTNFASQCLLAGGMPMNFTRDTGWYYRSPADRAAAWTGVEYLFRFLSAHPGPGPVGQPAEPGLLLPGDLVQLGDGQGRFYHTLLVVQAAPGQLPLVAAHSEDCFGRPLAAYSFGQLRGLHILGGQK